MDAAQRTVIAKIGANALHASRDSAVVTAPARAAFARRFEREVDPDGVLPEAERLKRAAFARRAFMLKLALKSSRVRASRKRKNATGSLPVAIQEVSRGSSTQPSRAE